jgi:hypothetical protein
MKKSMVTEEKIIAVMAEQEPGMGTTEVCRKQALRHSTNGRRSLVGWTSVRRASGRRLRQRMSGNALVGLNIRDRIRLGASGKIITAFDMVRVMALGADWCNSARGFMFALGCIQSLRCHRRKLTPQERARIMVHLAGDFWSRVDERQNRRHT